MTSLSCDLAIIGGGLSGGLIALAARCFRPDRHVLIVEAGRKLGGTHIWSFIDSDLGEGKAAARARTLLEPLINYGWRDYQVGFPAYRRTLPLPLYSMRSDRFDEAMREMLPADAIISGRRATAVTPTSVTLDDGTEIVAGGVIDARGPADLSVLDLHWRKFVGYELTLDGPHSIRHATLIEVAADRPAGFRYMTLLPIENDRLFAEDVRYEPYPEIDMADHGARIVNHAARLGWRIRSSARGQAGVVPIALGGDFGDYWKSGGEGIAKAGLRAGLFHPVNGNSLGDAVRTAMLIADAPDWSGRALHKLLYAHAARNWRKRAWYRRFAREMLQETPAQQSHEFLAALHLQEPRLIARFQGMRLSFADRLALAGKTGPMPISTVFRP